MVDASKYLSQTEEGAKRCGKKVYKCRVPGGFHHVVVAVVKVGDAVVVDDGLVEVFGVLLVADARLL